MPAAYPDAPVNEWSDRLHLAATNGTFCRSPEITRFSRNWLLERSASTYFAVAGTFGGAAMLLIVVGVVTGWSLALTLLTADTVVLWIVSTIRRAAGPRPHETRVRLGGQA